MVTRWFLIETIAMTGSPAARGAVDSVERSRRGAASAVAAAVSPMSAAVSITRVAGPRRWIASLDSFAGSGCDLVMVADMAPQTVVMHELLHPLLTTTSPPDRKQIVN